MGGGERDAYDDDFGVAGDDDEDGDHDEVEDAGCALGEVSGWAGWWRRGGCTCVVWGLWQVRLGGELLLLRKVAMVGCGCCSEGFVGMSVQMSVRR